MCKCIDIPNATLQNVVSVWQVFVNRKKLKQKIGILRLYYNRMGKNILRARTRKHKKTAGYIPAENGSGGSVMLGYSMMLLSLSLVTCECFICVRAHNTFSANITVSPVIFAQCADRNAFGRRRVCELTFSNENAYV